MAPGSPCPNINRPHGLCCLVETRQFKPVSLLPRGYPQLATQCQEPTTHLSEPRIQALLFCWFQETSLPTEHRGPAFHMLPDSKTALTFPLKSKHARFLTEGRKAMCYSVGGTRSLVPPRYIESQYFTLYLPAGSHVSPVQELKSQLHHLVAICYSAGTRTTVHRHPMLPPATAGEPLCPHQRAGTPAPSLRREKK
jgi:hypothetical protein